MIRSSSVLVSGCLAVVSVWTMAAGAESHRLPPWYEGARVQAHSEHSLAAALQMTPGAHARVIRSLGASVLCRIYLNRDEGAWWQSAVGEVNPLIGHREFAREISDAVHAEGLKVIAYHRHMSDAWVQREHPDWTCRLPDGTPMLEPRGKTKTVFVHCMNSPYRDYIQTRLIELADRGVDAIYFDNRHMPDICTCRWCREAFRKEMGRDMNPDAPPGSREYMDAVQFVNRTMVRTFLQWRTAVDQRHPEVFFVVKSSTYPCFDNPHMDTRLLRISDVSGTEFNKPFGRNPRVMRSVEGFAAPRFDEQTALGWSIVRDGAQGRPPHMWIPFCRTETQSLYSAAAAVAYGCVAAMNITLRDLDRDGPRARAIFCSTFDLGKKVSPVLAYSRPIPWAGLHISQRARNARLPDLRRMWREVFSPALGGFRALKEEHAPWVVVSDLDLAEGLDDRMRLLVLPWPEELNAAERKSVAALERRGGVVLRLDPQAGWHLKERVERLLPDLRRRVREAVRDAPVRVAGPAAMHAVCYRREETGRVAVCLVNRWDWFRAAREPNPQLQQAEPPRCRGVTVEFSPQLGRLTAARDAVTGRDLAVETTSDGARVRVPDFQIMACIAAEFRGRRDGGDSD